MVGHRRLTPKQELKACSLYADEHRTLREVARVYGLSPAGVRKILIWNNLARRRKKKLGVNEGDDGDRQERLVTRLGPIYDAAQAIIYLINHPDPG
jgi:hypothetical protein